MAIQSRIEHTFSWWHQGVFLYDRAYEWSEDSREYTEAASGQWIDQSVSGGVTFISPGGAIFGSDDAPLTIEVHDAPPPPAAGEADSVGEFDLALPSGELVLEESGGGAGDNAVVLPKGEWRARWSGFGEVAAEQRAAAAERPDRYVLQLWPRTQPAGVARIRGY
jgi:hypothetical protein